MLGPLFDLLYHAINSGKEPVSCATAKVCSQILLEKFTHVRSQVKEPPFPGVTQCTLFEIPATMNEPSDAPGFGTTFPGMLKRFAAFSNTDSSIAVGMLVIPLSAAVTLREVLDDVFVPLAGSPWIEFFFFIHSS